MMLLEKMASIFLTPYLLLFVVPKRVDDILQFVADFTVNVEGVGHVCSFSLFDFQNHGNSNYGSPYNSPSMQRSSQGKMEKSILSCRQLEVRSEDQTPQKWCVPLTEDVFATLMSKSSPTLHPDFGDGSLFSPLLFGKFFDPSDAFPLWEFESDILLSKLRSTSQSTVDWFQTDANYVLKAELPGYKTMELEALLLDL